VYFDEVKDEYFMIFFTFHTVLKIKTVVYSIQ